jgi:hypothetical protein
VKKGSSVLKAGEVLELKFVYITRELKRGGESGKVRRRRAP